MQSDNFCIKKAIKKNGHLILGQHMGPKQSFLLQFRATRTKLQNNSLQQNQHFTGLDIKEEKSSFGGFSLMENSGV